MSQRINCIITVHGMGEPLPNSTLMPVAERIAQEVCKDLVGDTLTLGLLSGLTGINGPKNPSFIPCIQLNGVSLEPQPGARPAIFPIPKFGGGDLYFADIFWSGITSSDTFDAVGDSLPHWTGCLLNRLDRKHKTVPGHKATWWVLDMLFLLRQTIVFAEKILALRFKELNKVVFGKYLGDVQLYAEFSHCRGEGVRLFHDTMEKIHKRLNPDPKNPNRIEYTVIAHSLGTVMALDSLMLAHANPQDWDPPSRGDSEKDAGPKMESKDLPFPGYDNGKPYPKLDWIDSVKAFVTLGSPIDKFLTLWWYNYLYLLDPRWILKRSPDRRIKHYNFCDEQDPVGHRLDFARTAPAFKAVFETPEKGKAEPSKWNDLVYNHSPVPGGAHTSYWKDQALFKMILDKVIRPEVPENIDKPALDAFRPYRRWTYFLILLIHFYLVPVFCIGLCHFTLTWALTAASWNSIALGTLAFLVALWASRELILLNLGWRRILKQGSRFAPKLPVQGSDWPKPFNLLSPLLHDRDVHGAIARWTWPVLALLNWTVCFKVLPALWRDKTAMQILKDAGIPVLILSAAVFLFLFFLVKKAFKFTADTRKTPPSLLKDIVRFRFAEFAWLTVALLPFFLTLFTPTRQWAADKLYWLSAWVPAWSLLSGKLLLYQGVLLQISAVCWVEVSSLHYWLKRRLNQGCYTQGPGKDWQSDFAEYAKEPAAPAPSGEGSGPDGSAPGTEVAEFQAAKPG
ncbi:MAG TPA: hypothetical protein VJ385_07615 [Fibrobacteria bacterium]|nr:hypothetical protein [Fibrobacteria bacterium]